MAKSREQEQDWNEPQSPRSRRNLTTDMSNVFLGKVPPQAPDLEQAVLGALMIDRDALSSVVDILKAESFYNESHQIIYKAITELFRSTRPIDMLTVTEELRKMGALEKAGGAFYIVELVQRVASSANIEYHARIIAQKYIQRSLIRVSTDIIRDAFEDTTDVFDLMDKAEQNLFSITETNLSRSFEGLNTLAPKLLKQIEELSKKADGLTGVPSGFTKLDRITAGWQPSDLIIMAARPAMGKTALTLSLAKNAAMEFNKPVAFFSLEMSSLQLVQRLISSEAEISQDRLRTGQLENNEWQKLQGAIERMSKTPIFIDDTPAINIFELRAKCRRLKAQHDIQLIIIDYLQLMTGGGGGDKRSMGNREQEISSISRGLKGLAKELNVPVIALSQLSRAVESRGGSKKPQLSDLRECVTGDTKIALADGRQMMVQDLVGQTPNILSIEPSSDKIVEATTNMIWSVGQKEVFEVKLTSGRSIKASAEHRIYTFEGWRTIQALQEGERIATVLKNDLFWDTIATITPCGEQEVFDVSVPETSSWIANGIVSHNSGAIEQDADIVSFIYRPEYYNITEDENGNSTKGIAEVIIAKHRNGSLDDVRLRFIGEYSKFADAEDFNFGDFGDLDPSDDFPKNNFGNNNNDFGNNNNDFGTSQNISNNTITLSSRMNDEDIPF